MSFTVAIIGRPNVGKSTLFNRLAGKKLALIDDTPGVTRDWRIAPARLDDIAFDLIDTAGYEEGAPDTLSARMWKQTMRSLAQADVALFMLDGRAGLLPDDRQLARLLHKSGKPVILAVNKCDNQRHPAAFTESYALNCGEPIAFSAAHAIGLGEVYDRLKALAPKDAFIVHEEEEDEDAEKSLHLAIVGRPNAGKSTLVNALVGEERMLTGPEPGLTRDAVHIAWEHNGKAVRLVDTAGMRKRARVEEKLEKMSVQETLRAIRLAHVVVLVADATQALEKQDMTIAEHVAEEGRALVIAVNKWDLIGEKDRAAYLKQTRHRLDHVLAQLAGVAVVPMSASRKTGLNDLMKAVTATYETWNRRAGTPALNRWLKHLTENHPPPMVTGRRIKLRYMTQFKSRPPTFALWGNKLDDLPDAYLRYLTNHLREAFDLRGVPIRWQMKKGDNPYDK
ncbi:MAG: ribosome biogenesis GTPase Der [Alphaproteobacteria bacterium]